MGSALTLPTGVTLRDDIPPRFTTYGRYAFLVNTPSTPLRISADGIVRLAPGQVRIPDLACNHQGLFMVAARCNKISLHSRGKAHISQSMTFRNSIADLMGYFIRMFVIFAGQRIIPIE